VARNGIVSSRCARLRDLLAGRLVACTLVLERFVKPVVWVLVAACGGAATGPAVGSAPGSSTTVTSTDVRPVSTLVDGKRAPDASEVAHYEFMADCLAEFGIPAEYDPIDGGLSIGVGADQSEALTEALETCRLRAGAPVGEPSEEFLRGYYPFLVRLYRCLVDEGLAVPDLVTEEAFVEDGGSWHPYQVLEEAAAAAGTGMTADLVRAEQVCPNDPDDPRWSDE